MFAVQIPTGVVIAAAASRRPGKRPSEESPTALGHSNGCTWDNLGWRLGELFGETDDELIDVIYDGCVRQQQESS